MTKDLFASLKHGETKKAGAIHLLQHHLHGPPTSILPAAVAVGPLRVRPPLFKRPPVWTGVPTSLKSIYRHRLLLLLVAVYRYRTGV